MKEKQKNDLEWDLTRYFPNVESPELANSVEQLIKDCSQLMEEFQGLEPGKGMESIDEYIKKMDHLDSLLRRTGVYLNCTVSANSNDVLAQKLLSRLAKASSERSKASTLFSAWIGTLHAKSLVNHSKLTQSHSYVLERTHFLSAKQMTPEAESVSEDLKLSGAVAWSRLYGDITSQMKVVVKGQKDPVGMSETRTLAYNADRDVRANAYNAEIEAWRENQVPIAACLNGIKGASLTLTKHRAWNTVLSQSLYFAGIDEATLSVMMETARNYFPEFRRYLRLKAKALQIPTCAFYDLFAPIPASGNQKEPKKWDYSEACDFVLDRFNEFAPQMGELAQKSFSQRWIDVMPRQGKRDGAFCAGSGKGESLVMMNFKSSYGSVSTLAHELGHAYHNYCLRDTTSLQRRIPMTLAETASTFCEILCRNKALEIMDGAQKLEVLEAALQNASQIVVDITSRFLFESRMIEARKNSDVSSEEICEIMRQAQIETYGDGLDPSLLHPYMWAAKPHYYGSDFYNYPYMFGLLFAQGLYARYLAEGKSFIDRYERLLGHSGMDSPANLANEFGIDIRKGDFWEDSLKVIVADIERFEALVK